jgi:outer membrane receptor protein involved in Fe transport
MIHVGSDRRVRTRIVELAVTSGIVWTLCASQASAQAQDSQTTPPSSQPASAEPTDSDIVVTARKREERLQDVPAPVSVVSAANLVNNNQSRLREYFSTIPGLQVAPTPGASNQQSIVIRGVSSGQASNPTVGIMLDDAPYGASNFDFGPEIDPSDLQRVEVLRGPQGTLYGANSMGGLIKYVTQEPLTSEASGRVQGGLSGVAHGNKLGYDFRAGVNVPLSDVLAVRLSGFTRKDPGYIDNVLTGQKDINSLTSSGGHASLLWKAASNVTVKLSALYQRMRGEGSSEETHVAGLAPYQQDYVRGAGQFTKTGQAYSANINADLAGIDLTSITAYSRFDLKNAVQDYSTVNPYGPAALRLFGVGGATSTATAGNRRFTQEVRAAFQTGPVFDWLLGAYYSDEDTPYFQTLNGVTPVTGANAGTLIDFNIPFKYREFALFGNSTAHLTDRLSVQVGGRYSFTNARYPAVTETGALLGRTLVIPAVAAKRNVFTYLISPQFKINSDHMIYARIASGYRPGRTNSFNTDPVPRVADPDTTTNYEVGAKGSLWSNLLSYDISLYHIDWKDVQLTLRSVSGLAFTANAGRARSQGAEVSATLRPGAGVVLTGWVSLNDAIITEGVINASTYAPDGSRLPFATRLTTSLSANKSFALTDRAALTVGATYNHVSKRLGTFVPTATRGEFPAYDKLDLNVGVTDGSWAFNVYAKNVTDTRGLLGGGIGSFPATAYLYLQPRVIGASISKNF